MATLRSRLLKNDTKLEGAATLDASHIVQGAKGSHVEKLQLALIILDDAKLITDGAYGPNMAAAVRSYKQKRKVVNKTYQTSADDIVGKMTIVAMDNELAARELTSPPRARIESIFPRRPLVTAGRTPISVGLNNIRDGLKAKGGGVKEGDWHDLPVLPLGPTFSSHFMELAVGASGVFRVENAKGGIITISDTRLAYVWDPAMSNAHGNFIGVYKDSLEFKVKALHPGSCQINVTFPASAQKGILGMAQGLLLKIRFVSDEMDFHPGVNHHHDPCKDWNKVKTHPDSGRVSSDTPEGGDGLVTMIGAPVIGIMVRNSNSPKEVVDRVLSYPFGPIAKTHLNWYLYGGGSDFVEDDNIRGWLLEDDGIRKRLAREIKNATVSSSNGLVRGHFFFSQNEYENDDYCNAFGAIDRVDFEADLTGGNLTVWFQDRYEWHPVYSGLYKQEADDEARSSNGIHAAFVEMKPSGAADFWMKGEYTVPMI